MSYSFPADKDPYVASLYNLPNTFSYSGSCRTTNKKLYFTSPPGTRRKIIPEGLRQSFCNKQIACYEYEGVTAEQEREIFQVCFALFRFFALSAFFGCSETIKTLYSPSKPPLASSSPFFLSPPSSPLYFVFLLAPALLHAERNTNLRYK